MLDVSKPMQVRFSTSIRNVIECLPVQDRYVVKTEKSGWYVFDKDGYGEHPSQRLVNLAPQPRVFTKKVALVEYLDVTYVHTITPAMEEYPGGLTAYFKRCVVGKVIAIKTIAITEGEGEPPVY